MRCLACKYDLSNLTEHRCPECGRGFDPNDPGTVDLRTTSPGVRIAIRIIVFMALLTGIVAIYVYYSFSAAFSNFHP